MFCCYDKASSIRWALSDNQRKSHFLIEYFSKKDEINFSKSYKNIELNEYFFTFLLYFHDHQSLDYVQIFSARVIVYPDKLIENMT